MKVSVVVFVFYFFILLGYGLNVYKFMRCDFQNPSTCVMVRSVGFIPHLFFIGYINFDE
jgi:hypothetical protein